ncbi:MAG: hypothetical protein WDN00_13930 [Limisphaerales bacterium]
MVDYLSRFGRGAPLQETGAASVTFKANHELVKTARTVLCAIHLYRSNADVSWFSAGSRKPVRMDRALFNVYRFWIKLKREEKLLLQHFPNDYPFIAAG